MDLGSVVAPHMQAGENRLKTKGRGKYRNWLPGAALRVCFGMPRSAKEKRRRLRGKVSTNSPFHAASNRVLAEFFGSNPTHIQKVKDALSLKMCHRQTRGVRGLPPAKRASLEISLDETEVIAELKNVAATRSMMMMHAKLRWRDLNGKLRVYQIIMPPAFLKNTTAPVLITAIMKRLPVPLSELKSKVKSLSLLIGSDSAKSCNRVDKHFLACSGLAADLDGTITLPGKCFQHKAGATLFSICRMFGITCPMFCACVLMHQGSVFEHLVRTVRGRVARDFQPQLEEPDRAKVKYFESLLALLDWQAERDYIAGGGCRVLDVGFLDFFYLTPACD